MITDHQWSCWYIDGGTYFAPELFTILTDIGSISVHLWTLSLSAEDFVHMSALAVFISATGSHPFLERRVILSEPAKIGRSVAQAKPSPTNTIFDCKVLSRNHAMLWYESGKVCYSDNIWY